MYLYLSAVGDAMYRCVSLLALCLATCSGCGGGGGGGNEEVIVLGDRGPRDDYYSIDVADMNGDGFLDLVAAGFTIINDDDRSWYVSVFRQDAMSPGSFLEPQNFTYGPFEVSPTEIEVADLQGDGLPDAVASSFSELGFRTMLHDTLSLGGLMPSVHYGPTGDHFGWPKLAAADMDGDLIPDVLTTGPDDLILYRQSAANRGTFLNGITLGVGSNNLAVADIDGDGLNDVLTFDDDNEHEVPDHLIYYRQNSNVPGQFLIPQRFFLDFSGGAVAVADVDADTRPDLIVSGFDVPEIGVYHGRLRIYRQLAPDNFQTSQDEITTSNLFSDRIAVSDLDGDGTPEIILGNRTHANDPNTVEVFAQDASNTYYSDQLLVIPDDRAITVPELFSVRVADLNDDGLPDIAVSTHEIFIFFARPGQPGTYGAATQITVQR